jgi:hypothetical protein
LNYGRKAIKASVENYEKKHNVKLHCAGVLPLLLWLFASDFGATAMSGATAQTVATGVSAATGTTLSLPSLVKKGAKVVWSLWQKIVAGVAATAVAVCAGVAVTNILSDEPEPQIWTGTGYIDIGLNFSNKNEFILTIDKMDEQSIQGTLTINYVSGKIHQTAFHGTGEISSWRGADIIAYTIELEQEIPGYFSDYAGYSALGLRYTSEGDYFEFSNGPLRAKLKK